MIVATHEQRRARRGQLSEQTRAEYGELLLAIGRLEQALAGQAQDLGRQMDADLSSVREILRRHTAAAEGPDGLFSEIDQERPTLARTVAKLRQEHIELQHHAAALHQLVHEEPNALDLADLRRRVTALAGALRHHQEVEMDAVFDTINLDLGTGD